MTTTKIVQCDFTIRDGNGKKLLLVLETEVIIEDGELAGAKGGPIIISIDGRPADILDIDKIDSMEYLLENEYSWDIAEALQDSLTDMGVI